MFLKVTLKTIRGEYMYVEMKNLRQVNRKAPAYTFLEISELRRNKSLDSDRRTSLSEDYSFNEM